MGGARGGGRRWVVRQIGGWVVRVGVVKGGDGTVRGV